MSSEYTTKPLSVRVTTEFGEKVAQAAEIANLHEADWLRGWLEFAVEAEINSKGLLAKVTKRLLAMRGPEAQPYWEKLGEIQGLDLNTPAVKTIIYKLWQKLEPGEKKAA